MRSTPKDSDSHTVDIGPVEVSAVDGRVHIAIGDSAADLDAAAADDLIHALSEAIEAAR